ncbi:MAG: hypothetical protein KR126chlam1_01180 [Chlamydiae bacterium]|nr:hypothetical protein [Chlamydiota bacterium]
MTLFCIASFTSVEGGIKQLRRIAHLPGPERTFARQLSVRQRRIFCRQFSASQREIAIQYATGEWKDSCLTPDEAVLKVMEETGMSLAAKGRKDLIGSSGRTPSKK